MKFKVSILNFLMLAALSFVPLHIAYSQTASILPPAKTTFFDKNGKPLAFGTVDFYIPGTTTPKMTWKDAGQTIPNTNPVVLDDAGRSIVLGDGSYRQVVKDKNGNVIWDQVTSSTGSGGGGGGTPTVGDGDPVGMVKAWAGFSAPYQYVFAYGQELVRTSYPEALAALTSSQNVSCTIGSATLTGLSDTSQLPIGAPIETACLNAGSTIVSKTVNTVVASSAAIISSNTSAKFFPYGNGDGSTTFNVPDLRGRVIAGRDNMGGIASNRLSFAIGLGSSSGDQSYNIAQSDLPNVSPVFTGDAAVINSVSNVSNYVSANVFSGSNVGPGSNGDVLGGTALGNIGSTANYTPTGTVSSLNGGVTQTSIPLIQPTQSYNYIIKILPDTNPNTFFGVASIGGMYGVIECGYGINCSGNTISAISAIVPPPQPSVLGGVFSLTCSTSNWFRSLDNTGTFGCSQPSFSDLTGVISNTQITNNSIDNTKLSQVGPATFKGNPTASTANLQDFTIQGLANLASPNSTLDYLPIYDHLTGTIKNTTPQNLIGSTVVGVSNINGMTGGISCGSNVTCTSNTIQVAAPLNNIYNVTSYGAVCNGITDDTAAINNAIAAIPAGSTLVFPSTVCLVSSLIGTGNPRSINVTKSVHINFANGGGIHQTAIGALFNIEANFVTIEGAAGATLTGPSTSTLYQPFSTAITTNNALSSTTTRQNIVVRGLRIIQFGSDGIQLNYCFNCTIENNFVYEMRYTGIVCIACNDSVIVNNTVENIWSSTAPSIPPDPVNRADHYGISVTNDGTLPSKNVIVANNVVRNVPAWECYDTHSGQNITFVNNIGDSCMIGLSAGTNTGLATTGIIIANNRFTCLPLNSAVYSGQSPGTSIGAVGIRVIGLDTLLASEVLIKGNIVSGCGSSDAVLAGAIGSIAVGYIAGASVEGNEIYLGRYAGISVLAPTFGSIMNNNIDQLTVGPIGGNAVLIDIVSAGNLLNMGGLTAFGSGYYGYNIAAQGAGFQVGIARSNSLNGATALYVGSSASNRVDLGASPP